MFLEKLTMVRNYNSLKEKVMRSAAASLVGISSLASGCVGLSTYERNCLREMKTYGLDYQEHKIKEPLVSAFLNVLPGIGNFYNAIGTEHADQALVGALNLLFWPLSITWGIPEAAIDADIINKKEAIGFYLYGPGKEKFEELRKKPRTSQ